MALSMAEPELSIVVAASHAAHTLAKCLDALGPQIAAVSTEVLVVASTDGEARLAHARLPEEKRSLWGDPRLVVYHQPSASLRGFARQRLAYGRMAGCRRAARSTRYRRLRDMLRAPAVPLIHLARIVKRLARQRRHRI